MGKPRSSHCGVPSTGNDVKEAISTTSSPAPAGPYSQGIVTDMLVFVAGQGPMDAATRHIPEGIENQTHQALRNVRSILQVSGATMDDVVKATVHLAHLNDFDDFNRVYRGYFHEPYPARTTVGSELPGILVEIDVIAQRSARRSKGIVQTAETSWMAARRGSLASPRRGPSLSHEGKGREESETLLRLWNVRLEKLEEWLTRARQAAR